MNIATFVPSIPASLSERLIWRDNSFHASEELKGDNELDTLFAQFARELDVIVVPCIWYAPRAFEKKFGITLSNDVKEIYKYKNGSKYLSILPCIIEEREMPFCLMSLQDIENTKEYFQNKDALLTEFTQYFSSAEIDKMRDSRVKPYLFNKKWIPFAEYCDSCFLMFDFDPDNAGKEGQIICYIHDPDEIVYVAKGITELIDKIMAEIN